MGLTNIVIFAGLLALVIRRRAVHARTETASAPHAAADEANAAAQIKTKIQTRYIAGRAALADEALLFQVFVRLAVVDVAILVF